MISYNIICLPPPPPRPSPMSLAKGSEKPNRTEPIVEMVMNTIVNIASVITIVAISTAIRVMISRRDAGNRTEPNRTIKLKYAYFITITTIIIAITTTTTITITAEPNQAEPSRTD